MRSECDSDEDTLQTPDSNSMVQIIILHEEILLTRLAKRNGWDGSDDSDGCDGCDGCHGHIDEFYEDMGVWQPNDK